jgi:ATP-dependent Clp protease ATP-binding subunit ClpA
MFNRFSRSARAAVVAAVAEAQRRGDARIGTEHLLLGLLHEADSVAVRAIGVDLDSARRALQALDVEALAAVGIEVEIEVDVEVGVEAQPTLPSTKFAGQRSFTAAARDALRRTLVEAHRQRARQLSPTHLLLALLDGGPRDPAIQLLTRLGVDAAVVRSQLSEAA